MARRPNLVHLGQKGIVVAIQRQLLYILKMSRNLPLDPKLLPASAVISHFPGIACHLIGFLIHISHHKNLAGAVILNDAWHKALLICLKFWERQRGFKGIHGNTSLLHTAFHFVQILIFIIIGSHSQYTVDPEKLFQIVPQKTVPDHHVLPAVLDLPCQQIPGVNMLEQQGIHWKCDLVKGQILIHLDHNLICAKPSRRFAYDALGGTDLIFDHDLVRTGIKRFLHIFKPRRIHPCKKRNVNGCPHFLQSSQKLFPFTLYLGIIIYK